MTTPRPRECEISRYRHGCDPPRKAKTVSPSDCKRLDTVGPHERYPLQLQQIPLIRFRQLQRSLLAAVFQFRPKRRKEIFDVIDHYPRGATC
jgi:hypothetical protein